MSEQKDKGMRHFVAYHNRDAMGEISLPFQVETRKPTRGLIGSVVWVVEGIGRSPKQYDLVSWFIVTRVEKSLRAEFETAAYGDGPDRHEFKERVRLNGFDWFPDFRTRMGNFAFGLQPVTNEEVVNRLLEIAASEDRTPGQPTRRPGPPSSLPATSERR